MIAFDATDRLEALRRVIELGESLAAAGPPLSREAFMALSLGVLGRAPPPTPLRALGQAHVWMWCRAGAAPLGVGSELDVLVPDWAPAHATPTRAILIAVDQGGRSTDGLDPMAVARCAFELPADLLASWAQAEETREPPLAVRMWLGRRRDLARVPEAHGLSSR